MSISSTDILQEIEFVTKLAINNAMRADYEEAIVHLDRLPRLVEDAKMNLVRENEWKSHGLVKREA